ncbi:hypothetical protein ACFIOY_04070 [Bradyrhizobium sp. TZ2]
MISIVVHAFRQSGTVNYGNIDIIGIDGQRKTTSEGFREVRTKCNLRLNATGDRPPQTEVRRIDIHAAVKPHEGVACVRPFANFSCQ